MLSFSFNKKTRRYLFCLFAVGGLLFAAISFLSPRFAFDRYTQALLAETFAQDTLSLHFALANPEDYGFSQEDPTLGTFSTGDATLYAALLENQAAALESFDTNRLSKEQSLTLEILKTTNTLDQEQLAGFALWNRPSSTLGIQTELPTLFAEYAFRRQQDIDTYFQLLSDTPRYFADYIASIRAAANEGYGPARETLEDLIAQCREFLGDQSREHFLQRVFDSRCEACDFLAEEERQSLSDEHYALLTSCVFAAYEDLISGFQALYSQAGELRGLAAYTGGKAYYQALVQSLCGTDMTLAEIRLRLYNQLFADIQSAGKLELSSGSEETVYDTQDALTMLQALKEETTSYFPSGPEVSWELKEVDDALAAYASPAFYMIPPADALSENTIYLNPRENLSGFSLYTTLAHEGFPGHLYQTTYYYSQDPPLIRRILSFGGYSEGWATYAESLICEIEGKNWEGAKVYWLDRSLNLCIASLMDLGVNGDGWSLERAQDFLADFGITEESSAKDLYQYVVENPGNYLRYYLGCLSFLDLRSRCQKALGEDFDLTAFHEAVLQTGPCPFSLLETEVENQLGIS